MLLFKAVENSSIWDVCLNTYGSVNFLVKLMVDNNFANVNAYPYAGQDFVYDETLITDANGLNKDIKYATS